MYGEMSIHDVVIFHPEDSKLNFGETKILDARDVEEDPLISTWFMMLTQYS